jgi:hypothetical protein
MRLGKTAVFLLAAVVTSLLFINFCNLVYQCGCRSLWAGAAEHCNIHDAESRHCPWCSIGVLGAGAVWGVIVGSQAAVAFLWRGSGWVVRAALALAAFPVVGGVVAVALGLMQGYWG